MPNHTIEADAQAFSDRLKEAMADCGIDTGHGAGVWLARRFKTSKYTGNAWLNGSHKPTPDRAREMANMLSVQFEWLYIGHGAKRTERGIAEPRAGYGINEMSLTAEEVQLLRHYRAADEPLRNMVDAVLHATARPKAHK